jgi:hypothetical protein
MVMRGVWGRGFGGSRRDGGSFVVRLLACSVGRKGRWDREQSFQHGLRGLTHGFKWNCVSATYADGAATDVVRGDTNSVSVFFTDDPAGLTKLWDWLQKIEELIGE